MGKKMLWMIWIHITENIYVYKIVLMCLYTCCLIHNILMYSYWNLFILNQAFCFRTSWPLLLTGQLVLPLPLFLVSLPSLFISLCQSSSCQSFCSSGFFFTFVFVLWLVLYESHLWGNGQCARHECGKSWLLIPGQMKPKTIKLVFSATLLSIKE